MADGNVILPIIGALPDPSNPPGLEFTATLNIQSLVFDGGSTNEIVYWQFRAPADYASGPLLKIEWFGTSGTTSGQVKWACQVLAVTGDTDSGAVDSEAFDSENPSVAATFDTHLGTTGDRLHTYSLTLSNADSMAAGDLIVLKVYRDASDTTNDTYAADAHIAAATFQYTTS